MSSFAHPCVLLLFATVAVATVVVPAPGAGATAATAIVLASAVLCCRAHHGGGPSGGLHGAHRALLPPPGKRKTRARSACLAFPYPHPPRPAAPLFPPRLSPLHLAFCLARPRGERSHCLLNGLPCDCWACPHPCFNTFPRKKKVGKFFPHGQND